MQEECEGLSISGNWLYIQAKEDALEIAKPFPILQTDFVETLAMVFEESEEITGSRIMTFRIKIKMSIPIHVLFPFPKAC